MAGLGVKDMDIKKNTWIIANWKSNKTIKEALEWLDIVGPQIPKKDNLKIAVCPPFTDLEEVKRNIMVNNYPILIGAQDLSPFEEGPFTGEEAAKILKDFVDLTILGHSERRQNFGETDQIVAEKVLRAKEYNIIPLVCVQNQNTLVPEGVNLIAYEPIFAIGTGNPDTPQNANQVAVFFKTKYSDNLDILYGGSIDENNAKAFLQQSSLSGLLIGSKSLDPQTFLKIINIGENIIP